MGGGYNMTSNEFPTFRFRVLPYYDSTHKYYVAQCLETGSITTAEDSETVMEMMVELLEDEASYAVKYDNLGNLYSAPASKDVWNEWVSRAKKFGVEYRTLNVKMEKVALDDTDPSAQVELVRSA
jgi:hypothetical protein